MLLGTAVGVVAAAAARLLVPVHLRPDVVIALALWVPSAAGLLLILISTRRWITTTGGFLLALAPGWFGVLVLGQVMSGA